MKRLLLAAALLLAAGRTDAAILATCSEDVTGCIFQGAVGIDSTAGRFAAGYARFGIRPDNNTATTMPAPNRTEVNFSAPSSDFWASIYYYPNNISVAINVPFITFGDAGGIHRLGLRASAASSTTFKLAKRNAAGTITDLATATGSLCGIGALCKLDIHVVYAVAGSVNVYNNNTLILTYSGDVTTDSTTALSIFAASNFGNVTNGGTTLSEMIVADTDTRSMRMITCAPLAAGNTQSWTGTVGNINANSYNDTVFNYTTANNALSQWTTGCTIPASGTTSIVDVRSSARLAKGASGPQNARFNLRISGADYNPGSNISGLTTSFQNFTYDWGANSPATGTPWVPSEFGSGFNLGVLSQP